MANRIVFITGTSSGVGKDLALFFLNLGFTVIGCSRRTSDIADRNYHHYNLDLNSETETEKIIGDILAKFDEGIDIFISNAGKFDRELLLLQSDEKIKSTFSINVTSPIVISKSIGLNMIKNSKNGIFIYLSSVASVLDDVGTVTYASSKSALETFARIFDKEIIRFGLRALTLRIALIESPMTESLSETKKTLIRQKSGESKFQTASDIGNFVLEKFDNQKLIGDICLFQ